MEVKAEEEEEQEDSKELEMKSEAQPQHARSNPIGEAAAKAADDDRELFKLLIADPFARMLASISSNTTSSPVSPPPCVIMLDALDELSPESMDEVLNRYISGSTQFVQVGDHCLRPGLSSSRAATSGKCATMAQ